MGESEGAGGLTSSSKRAQGNGQDGNVLWPYHFLRAQDALRKAAKLITVVHFISTTLPDSFEKSNEAANRKWINYSR
jgi:hypothetical protein